MVSILFVWSVLKLQMLCCKQALIKGREGEVLSVSKPSANDTTVTKYRWLAHLAAFFQNNQCFLEHCMWQWEIRTTFLLLTSLFSNYKFSRISVSLLKKIFPLADIVIPLDYVPSCLCSFPCNCFLKMPSRQLFPMQYYLKPTQHLPGTGIPVCGGAQRFWAWQ